MPKDTEIMESTIDRLRRFIESSQVQNFILFVIIINAIVLGLQTSPRLMEDYGGALNLIDKIALGIFVVELSIKLIVYRFQFFKDGWNIFDFIIVGIALLPIAEGFSVLRALRIMRALRVMSVVPQMKQVVQALLSALPGMTSVIVVLVLIFYVAAVMTTKLFGTSPNPDIQEWFGSVGKSLYSLFQIMTLESWSMGIVRPVMEEYPLAWIFFIPFICMTSFMVLNLFIALIVNSMEAVTASDKESEEQASKSSQSPQTPGYGEDVNSLAEQLTVIQNELAEIRETISGRHP